VTDATSQLIGAIPAGQDQSMLAVLLYQSADDIMESAPRHYSAHRAYALQKHAEGVLLMIGTFADPVTDGAMGVLVSEDSAHEFAQSDPFVVNGVVKSYRVLGWAESLTQN